MSDAEKDAAAAAMRDDVPDDAAKVFLSYSRRDREKAQLIADALRARSFGVFRDTDDILPTEEWRERLEELIAEADTIVFLLSPHSAVSEVCAWELDHASALNKRIAPIVIEEVAAEAIPPKLARLNFIFCTARDPFENAVATLASALNTDIDWVREHTRLGGLARRWQAANEAARLLLRGQDIADAEAWRDARPEEAPAVTPAQARFVAESRRAAGRRQRMWAAGAFAVAAVTAGLAVFAYVQKQEADGQRAAAEASAIEAARQRDAAEARLREANIERTRRSIADAGASLAASEMEAAAAAIRGAIEAALDLGDAELTEAAADVGRRLVFADRLEGYLEGGFADPLAHPTLQPAPDGASAIGLAGERLTVWSMTTGLARFAATGVAAAEYRSDGVVIGVRSTPVGEALVFSVDPASGATATIGRFALALRDAWVFPAAGVALLAGARDGQPAILAVDLASGAVRFEAAPAFGQARLAAASPDGQRLLVSGEDGGVLMHADGAIRARFRSPAEPRLAGFAPVGDAFFLRTDLGFHLGEPEDGGLRLVPAGDGPAEDVVFLGDGRIAVQRGTEPARLLDMATLEETGRLDGRISFGLVGVDRVQGVVVARGPQQFFVHDARTGALRHRIGRPSPPIGGWSLSPDGRHLATLLQDGLVSVWSTETGREVMAVMPAGGAARIQMLERPGGAAVAAIDGEGRLGLWRAKDARLVFGRDVVTAEPALKRAVATNAGYGAPAAIWDLDAGVVRQAFDGAVIRSVDPTSGRILLALPEGDAVLAAPGSTPVPLEAATGRSVRDVAWGAGGRLAIRRAETIDLYDASGRLAGSIPRAAPEAALPALRFSDDGARLVFLTTRPSVAIADATNGKILTEAALPEAGRALHAAAAGDGGFIVGADIVYRFDGTAGTTLAVVPTPANAVLAAGPYAAVLQSGGIDERTVWLADMTSGERRFSPPWRGGAYALGDRDRLLAEETATGDLYLADAATGEARLHVPGDGGADAVPTPPRLCPGEELALAVNGGGAMARFVDTASGQMLASVRRRDGYKGPIQLSADCSLLRLAVDGISYVYDLADVRLDPAGLAEEIERRYPALPPQPAPDAEANECDRLAANPLDPEARAEGVAYDDLTPEALAACAARFDGGAASARDAYQLARVAGRFRPEMDTATLDLLREAANAGYAAAQHALAIRLIEGRGDGEADPAAAAAKWLLAASEGGMGAATAVLARLAAAGLVPGDADESLETGVAAGRPAAMDAAARRLAAAYEASGDAGAAAGAARLWRSSATGFAARRQAQVARRMLDRAAALARRVSAWPEDDRLSPHARAHPANMPSGDGDGGANR